jgi:hypothetical protein
MKLVYFCCFTPLLKLCNRHCPPSHENSAPALKSLLRFGVFVLLVKHDLCPDLNKIDKEKQLNIIQKQNDYIYSKKIKPTNVLMETIYS